MQARRILNFQDKQQVKKNSKHDFVARRLRLQISYCTTESVAAGLSFVFWRTLRRVSAQMTTICAAVRPHLLSVKESVVVI